MTFRLPGGLAYVWIRPFADQGRLKWTRVTLACFLAVAGVEEGALGSILKRRHRELPNADSAG